jgi:protein-tyrosine kinase
MEPRLAAVKVQPEPTVEETARPSAVERVAQPSAVSGDGQWAALERAEIRPRVARKGRLVTFARSDPAHASFDVLRTKLLKTLRLNGWTTVAITSPEPGCGKSVVSVNLAFSLAKLCDCRIVLLDLDFRRPRMSAILGPDMARPTAAFVGGSIPLESAFVRYGDNLAVSAGRNGVDSSAELLQSQSARSAMEQIRERLKPDVVLVDLPPVLGGDDVLAFLPNVDCTLMVVGAGMTNLAQVRRCEEELAGETNLVGMVLNKCRHGHSDGYY